MARHRRDVDKSNVSRNAAGTDGGGIDAISQGNYSNPFPPQRTITISQSLISGNTAAGRGGGVYTKNFDGTETQVSDSRITGNSVPTSNNGLNRNGGGIYAFVQSA